MSPKGGEEIKMVRKGFLTCALLMFALVSASPAVAVPITYEAILSGLDSPSGTGHALVVIDTAAHTMYVNATFSDLVGPTTASHIHAATAVPGVGTAGVATQTPTFIGFPLGVTSGSYETVLPFDLTLASSWNPAYITAHGGIAGAEADFAAAMAEGKTYFNIHTTFRPAGEIRGFLTPVPEPSTLFLLGSGLIGLVGYGRKRMKK